MLEVRSEGTCPVSGQIVFVRLTEDTNRVRRVAVEALVNGTVEIAGPEPFRLDELIRRRLAQLHDSREVITDPNARYSGAKVDERTLVPGKGARLGETRFETWLTQPAAKREAAAH